MNMHAVRVECVSNILDPENLQRKKNGKERFLDDAILLPGFWIWQK